jgi:hypothetical protein
MCGHFEIVKYLIIDCNMTIKEETLQYLQDKNLTDIIKLRDLQQKLDSSLDNNIIENKLQIKFKI